METVNLEEILSLIKASLNDFYIYDSELFNYPTEDAAVCERSMVFHIGTYIKKRIECTSFDCFNVDVEYNRNFDHPKSMYKETLEKTIQKNTYPDLIIHKRKSNKNNLLIVEFKKGESAARKGEIDDREKLEYFTNENGPYKYQYGLWVILYKEEVKIHVFQKGKELSHIYETVSLPKAKRNLYKH